MKMIYVSGPLSASTRWEIEKNQRHIQEVGLRLIKEGWSVVTPCWFGDYIDTGEFHKIMEEHQNGNDSGLERAIMESDLESVRRTDAIYMCRGWKGSAGAREEYEEAVKHGKEIYYEE